jgi:uncharacterized MAPEG superfamily protein
MTLVSAIGWSVVLLLVQIVAQTLSLAKDTSFAYAMSPRESADPRIGELTRRLTRALSNLLETYPAFIALALALIVTNKATGQAMTGAAVWFWARVVYVPVYAAGIPVVRTGIWTVSIVGLVMMLTALWS